MQVFPGDSNLAEDLSTAILSLLENGDLQRIHDKWWTFSACSIQSNDQISTHILHLRSYAGLFLVCGIATVVSILVYYLKIYFTKCRREGSHEGAAAQPEANLEHSSSCKRFRYIYMDSVSISSLSLLPATATPMAMEAAAAAATVEKEVAAAADVSVSLVDPFLVEALQNPRHRLTILRMELDVQRFLQNSDLQQFEFQAFPTSYLRLAAHRVAQHYGLQTMVLDNVVDCQGIRILVRKKPESKYPTICLSDIPVKQQENVKFEQVKIVLKQRPNKENGAGELGSKRSPVRTVEERKEEYDRARARIFNSQSSSESEDTWSRVPSDEKGSHLDVTDDRNFSSVVDVEKNIVKEIGSSSRVAIFRDREKDRTDPDYDRSYERYVRNAPPTHQNFSLPPYVPNLHQPYVHYDSVHPQFGLMPGTQAPPLHYRNQALTPFCAGGLSLSQPARDPVYFQWPTQSMMYVNSYDQLRHSVFQAACYQQPLSFDYSIP